MTDKLGAWEIQLLREVAGELPRSTWGAAVGAGLEYLAEGGYLTSTFGSSLTQKGRAAIESYTPSTPETSTTTFDLLVAASSRYYVRLWGSIKTHAVFDARNAWGTPPVYGPYDHRSVVDACRALNLEEILRVMSTPSPERDATLRAHPDRELIEGALAAFAKALADESLSAGLRRPLQP